MKRFLAAAALLALAPPVPAPAQQPSMQQRFDAASEALRAERWEEALQQFEAIEARLAPTDRRSLAIVRVRKADALVRLGRREEARTALQLGLADLPESDASLNEDRFLGFVALGQIAELTLDYAEAARHYRTAKALPVPVSLRLTVYRGLIQTQMFDNAPAALADADEALALARDAATGAQHEGVLRTLRGRVLLSMGRHGEARSELRTAMERLGGLTRRVNLADIVARSDLAIAAMLDGRQEDARRYLAYTGAGHHETSFSPGTGRMEPPPCGDELGPDDVAVLEFSVRDDGSLGHVMPIYSSRQGRAALAFARAARSWAWEPEAFSEVPLIFRMGMRVAVRCTQRQRDDDGSGFSETDEMTNWYAAHGIASGRRHDDAPLSRPAQLREELAQREAAGGPHSPTLLGPLISLARHPSVGSAETAGYLSRALPIAVEARAPAAVIAGLAVRLASSEQRERHHAGAQSPPDYAAILAHPSLRDDPRAAAAIRVRQAAGLYQQGEDREAADLLIEIRRTAGLAQEDPIMKDILALEVVLAAAREDWDAARATYQAIGPSAEPCRPRPRISRPSSSSRDFPDEAYRWGFEGWAWVEAAPTRDGELGRPRTIVSYPAFVFDESAERIAGRISLEHTYLPDERSCSPIRQLVSYRLEP